MFPRGFFGSKTCPTPGATMSGKMKLTMSELSDTFPTNLSHGLVYIFRLVNSLLAQMNLQFMPISCCSLFES